MQLGELIARLDELLEEGYSENTEVLLGHQPSWPLQFTVSGVVGSDDLERECSYCGLVGEHDEDCDSDDGEGEPIIYVVEGSHPDHPYAPRGLWDFV